MSRTTILLFALAVSPVRPAQGAESADEIIENGIDQMHARDYEGALRSFLDANARDPSPKAVAEIGLAEQALDRWADAEVHLALALRSSSDRWIGKYHAVLSAALVAVQGHLGSLFVDGTPIGGEIRFGGDVLGTIPLTLASRVPTGPHSLDVRANGYKPLTLSLTIAAGDLRRVRVALEPDPPSAVAPIVLHSASTGVPGPAQVAGGANETVAWIGIVGGVILGVGGILLYKLDDQRLGLGAMTVGAGATIGATAGLVIARFR